MYTQNSLEINVTNIIMSVSGLFSWGGHVRNWNEMSVFQVKGNNWSTLRQTSQSWVENQQFQPLH